MADTSAKEVLKPRIHESVFIAEGARIYGDVEIQEGASIWFNAVIRGDEGRITIGRNTNVQDNVVIHSDGAVVEIGDNVTIGHGSVVRSAKIEKNVMIGMNATIMSGAEIGEYAIVGASSFVSYNKKFPSRSMVMGVPAKHARNLSEDEILFSEGAVLMYKEHVKNYTTGKIVGYEK